MLNDGTGRRPRLYPTRISGSFEKVHVASGWLLLAILFVTPWIPIGGHPMVHIDLPERRFYVLGMTLSALDTPIIWLSLLIGALLLGLVTSLLGRVWCGYACPQTVFLHEIVHKLEAWIEGNRGARRRLDDAPWTSTKIAKKSLKWSLFALVSGAIALTGVSYFAPAGEVWTGASSSTVYSFAAAGAALLFADLAWFREQFCNYLCPYARIQSVLQDPHTVSVGYDVGRGEPRRGTVRAGSLGGPIDLSGNAPRVLGKGECVDCGLCVAVCPQGIDIRHGFQLECISCARCVDACTSVMQRRNLPSLIHYTTEARLQGLPAAGRRVRPFIYAGMIAVLGIALAALVHDHAHVDATVTRMPGDLFTILPDGSTQNQFRAHVLNYSDTPQAYRVSVRGLEGAEVVSPSSSVPVPPGKELDLPVFVIMPPGSPKTRTTGFEIVISSGSDEVARPATFKTAAKE